MSDIDRLDFSKPPPGYEVTFVRRMGNFGEAVGFWWRCGATWSAGHFDNEPEALPAAWAHHKARRNPPGMWTGFDSILPDLVERTPRMGVYIPGLAHIELDAGRARFKSIEEAESAARVAAWQVYEDAVEVADLLDGENGPAETWPERCAWPRPLRWTAEQRAEIRQLCLEGGKWPEVLRAL